MKRFELRHFHRTWKGRLAVLALLLLVLLLHQYQTVCGFFSRFGLYKYQQAYLRYDERSTEYRITLVSDMDQVSRVHPRMWKGIVKEGLLVREGRAYSVIWTKERVVYSRYNEGGRGMELSELVHYNGRVLTCDDRTGIVYEFLGRALAPKWILTELEGESLYTGFKCEWMTVKGNLLYVGSTGREYTSGEGIEHYRNTMVKTIDVNGVVREVDWDRRYQVLREKTSSKYPGYLIHEAVGWSQMMKRWVFMPRRLSLEAYDESLDESKGTNTVLIASEDFSEVKKIHVGSEHPLRGVSSFKFIPFRENEVVIIKSMEYKNTSKSYILVADLLDQSTLMEETEFSNVKFEGIEIT